MKYKLFYKIFHLAALELQRNILGRRYFAEFDLTDRCNLRCIHCYHFRGKTDIKKDDVSFEVWEKRFNDLYSSGIRIVLLVGGEPALKKDVLELAGKIFPYVYLITNGTILIPEYLNFCLFVSIDGSENTNDLIRGKGVFLKVLANYSGDKRVIINITITKDNYKELEDVVKIAKTHEFKGVVCNIYTPKVNEVSDLVISKEERKLIMDELKRVKSIYPDDFLLTKSMIEWYEFPDHTDYCYWANEVCHFDVSWNKRKCFSYVDCSNCGCFAGSFNSPLVMMKHAGAIMKFII